MQLALNTVRQPKFHFDPSVGAHCTAKLSAIFSLDMSKKRPEKVVEAELELDLTVKNFIEDDRLKGALDVLENTGVN